MPRLAAEVTRLRDVATVSYDVNLRPSISGTGPEVVARIERLVAVSDIVKASDEDLDGLRPGLSSRTRRPTCWGEARRRSWSPGWGRGVAVHGRQAVDLPALRVEVADTIGAGDSLRRGHACTPSASGTCWVPRPGPAPDLDETGWREVLGFAARAAAVTVSRPGADPPYAREL